MGIYDSKTWISDLDEELEQIKELNTIAESTILITGATGLICSAVIDMLIRFNEKRDTKINIIAAGRTPEKIVDRFYPFSKENYFKVISYDAACPEITIQAKADYIIHGASNASPGKIIKEPVETMMSNFIGLKKLFDYAKANSTKRVIFISSSEVYGQKNGNQPFSETDYGFIDILNSRNSYSVSKRAGETLCASYSDEYGVDFNIVRPGHIYGPTAGVSDNRVSSAWAFSAAEGKDIVMKSEGSQIRSYCYCADCACAILKIILNGAGGNAYNISNPDSVISIKKMAEILTEKSGAKLIREIPADEEKKSFNPMNNSSLDAEKLMKLGWKGIFDADRGFSHTIRIIKECQRI